MMPVKPLHVVHIIPTLTFGGAERFVVDLVNASDPKKIRFTIITLFHTLSLASEILPGQTEVVVVEKKGKVSLSLFGALRRELIRLQPDVVHTHLFGGDFWGRVAAHQLGIPVVTTEHNTNVDESVLKRFLKRRLRNWTHTYTAYSQAVLDFAKSAYQIPEVKMIRIGVPLAKFQLLAPKFSSPTRFLFLGRLEPQKGHHIALEALQKIQRLDWSLTIVGEGSREAELRRLVSDLGLEKQVRFLPPTGEVVQLLKQSDVLLLSSLWEGLGIVVMEAMAAGRLVVASRVGGIPELIDDQKNGLLSTAGSVSELSELLTWVMEHPSEVKVLAKKAQEKARANFGVERMAKEYQELYTKIV